MAEGAGLEIEYPLAPKHHETPCFVEFAGPLRDGPNSRWPDIGLRPGLRVLRVESYKQGKKVTKVTVFVSGDKVAAKDLLDKIEDRVN